MVEQGSEIKGNPMRILLSLSMFLLACPSSTTMKGPGICLCAGDVYAETGGLMGGYTCNIVEEGETYDCPCDWYPDMSCEEAEAAHESG